MTNPTQIHYSPGIPATEIDSAIAATGATRVFTIADTTTARLCLPLLQGHSRTIDSSTVLTVEPGDACKTLEAAAMLWQALGQGGATRSAAVINLGGGMVSDLGGFVASTFKRGMPYINVPTTLLGAVDASVGGKTGINFGGFKNEIGVFAPPATTVVSTAFFPTLPRRELLSGYAEMLKHALLSGTDALGPALSFDVPAGPAAHSPELLALLRQSIATKTSIVASDPTEKGLRKALNLGHTAGHAIESLALERRTPVPHGYAVAWGCVVELVLSHMQLGFPTEWLYRTASRVKELYGPAAITCDDYPRLLRFMAGDKKNTTPDAINFTLLHAPGRPEINRTATPADISSALDIFRDLTD